MRASLPSLPNAPSVLEHAEGLIEQVETIEAHTDPPDTEEQRAALAAAEEAMWAWYREWGTIARAAIKDRSVLRQLGFLSGSRARASGEEEGGDVTEAPAPVTSATVAVVG